MTEKLSSPAMMVWQLDRMIGQLILVGDHYADPNCPCSYGYSDPTGVYVSETCIPKHLLAIYEYATETSLMTGDKKLKAILIEIADQSRQIRDTEKLKLCGQETEQVDIAEWSRDHRKSLEPFTYETACQLKARRKKAAPVPPPILVHHGSVNPPAPARPARVRFNRGDLEGALEAALLTVGEKPLYVFATAHGYTISPDKPDHQKYYTALPGLRLVLPGGKEVTVSKRVPAPAGNPAGSHAEVCRYQHFFRQSHVPFLDMPEDIKTGSHDWHRFCIDGYDKSLSHLGCPASMATGSLPVPAPPPILLHHLPPAPPKPFGWVGGKTQLAKTIVAMMPEHRTYVEPFCGSASVFWKKEPSETEVLSDMDSDLMRFYKTINSVTHCKIGTISKNWADLRARTGKLYACEFLAQVLCSFADMRRSRIKDNAANRKGGQTNKCFDHAPQFHKNLAFYKERLKGVKLFREDWESVVKRFDSASSFIYLDPPYHGTSREYNHDGVELDRLARVLPRLKGKWLLSYDDHPDVRKAFKGYTIIPVVSHYTVQAGSNAAPGKQLLIANYPVKRPPAPAPSNGHNIVLVKWSDAVINRGVFSKKDAVANKPAIVETMGHLLSRDKETVIVAAEYADDDRYRDITIIPSVLVISVEKLTRRPAPVPAPGGKVMANKRPIMLHHTFEHTPPAPAPSADEQEGLGRLLEIRTEMLELIEEARQVLEEAAMDDHSIREILTRAEAYWLNHLEGGIKKNMGGSFVPMDETLEELGFVYRDGEYIPPAPAQKKLRPAPSPLVVCRSSRCVREPQTVAS
ncbi:hypothetical protein LCGC14_0632170 [marine sediment metagenome]|uniref:site-specific DNA-methyltransferase (adenine-specific) n=1 Tax=marine sediment metagenome TaxID=412755 RepID=A0A0F9RL18_9ZZZZ